MTSPAYTYNRALTAPPRPTSATIANYRQAGGVVYYILDIVWGQKNWTVEHRYSEFDALYEKLSLFSTNIPVLGDIAPKTWAWADTSGEDFLNERKSALNSYLQELLLREFVLSSLTFLNFINAMKHISPFPQYCHLPLKLKACTQPRFGVNRLVYLEEKKLMVTVAEDTSDLKKLDAFLANVKLPWEKEEPTPIPTGSLRLWKLDEDGQWGSVFAKELLSPAPALAWDAFRSRAVVALDNGAVEFYGLNPEHTSLELQHSVQLHTARIMDVLYNPTRDIVITCSQDKTLAVYDVKADTIVCQGLLGSAWLSALAFDDQSGHVFVGDYSGAVMAYDVKTTDSPVLRQTLNAHAGSVRSLFFHPGPDRSILFTGSFDHRINIWSVENKLEVGDTRCLGAFDGGPAQKIKSLVYCPAVKQVVSGHSTGLMSIWSFETGRLLHVAKAHQDDILTLSWLEAPRILVSGAKDGKVKFWTFFTAKMAVPFGANVEDVKVTEDEKKHSVSQQVAHTNTANPFDSPVKDKSQANPFDDNVGAEEKENSSNANPFHDHQEESTETPIPQGEANTTAETTNPFGEDRASGMVDVDL